MTSVHPNTQKAELRALLAVDQVVTVAQLDRWDLLQAAGYLRLPCLELTCRTRVTQPDSYSDLTFVALEREPLDLAPRELMHLCGLAEARRGRVLEPGERWRHVSLKGRSKGNHPDAEIIQTLDRDRRSDCAVEFDAGYARDRVAVKLIAAAADGYTRILWATSIHARTRTVMTLAVQLHRAGRLPNVTRVETRFADFWSAHDPYVDRPRCHKAMTLTQDFSPAR